MYYLIKWTVLRPPGTPRQVDIVLFDEIVDIATSLAAKTERWRRLPQHNPNQYGGQDEKSRLFGPGQQASGKGRCLSHQAVQWPHKKDE